MLSRSIVIALLSLFLIPQPAIAIEPKEVRIANAVKRIITAHHVGGERPAIEILKACYQVPLVGNGTAVVLQVEECISQDIAYANFSAGIYRQILKAEPQPQYVTIEAMKARVFSVTMSGGLSRENAEKFLRIIASIALDSLAPAIQSLPDK